MRRRRTRRTRRKEVVPDDPPESGGTAQAPTRWGHPRRKAPRNDRASPRGIFVARPAFLLHGRGLITEMKEFLRTSLKNAAQQLCNNFLLHATTFVACNNFLLHGRVFCCTPSAPRFRSLRRGLRRRGVWGSCPRTDALWQRFC